MAGLLDPDHVIFSRFLHKLFVFSLMQHTKSGSQDSLSLNRCVKNAIRMAQDAKNLC